MDDWRFERFDKKIHRRGEFCCGRAPLDEFIRTLVSQYEKRRLGRTYVAVLPNDPHVHGYYTLATSSVAFQNLPPLVGKSLPKHPVPGILLGRLAVDQKAQGRGLGAMLLIDALIRCLSLSDQVGVFGVEVDAIDEPAKTFYLKYGFVPLLDHELHLFLSMQTMIDGAQWLQGPHSKRPRT